MQHAADTRKISRQVTFRATLLSVNNQTPTQTRIPFWKKQRTQPQTTNDNSSLSKCTCFMNKGFEFKNRGSCMKWIFQITCPVLLVSNITLDLVTFEKRKQPLHDQLGGGIIGCLNRWTINRRGTGTRAIIVKGSCRGEGNLRQEMSQITSRTAYRQALNARQLIFSAWV